MTPQNQARTAWIFRGVRDLMQPPIDDTEAYWSPHEKAQAAQMLACSVVASPEAVRKGLRSMIDGQAPMSS